MTAPLPKLVSQMNASIHVIELFVVQEPNVRLKLIVLSATVLLEHKEIHWYLVQKLVVHPMQNVLLMKNAIM